MYHLDSDFSTGTYIDEPLTAAIRCCFFSKPIAHSFSALYIPENVSNFSYPRFDVTLGAE
jgi:hypothetical protein